MSQLELFEPELMGLPMRTVMDTMDVSLSGLNPEQAIEAIQLAKVSLPVGAHSIFFEIRGSAGDIHQVCRLRFRRPQTIEECQTDSRYRLKAVVA